MPQIIHIPTHPSKGGQLSVLEDIVPFEIRRVFYIYRCDDTPRGHHRHRTTHQLLICLSGRCTVDTDNGQVQESFVLDDPAIGLYLLPEDYHVMRNFSPDGVLLVLASTPFDPADYIHAAYRP
jgi:hypothetical protein